MILILFHGIGAAFLLWSVTECEQYINLYKKNNKNYNQHQSRHQQRALPRYAQEGLNLFEFILPALPNKIQGSMMPRGYISTQIEDPRHKTPGKRKRDYPQKTGRRQYSHSHVSGGLSSTWGFPSFAISYMNIEEYTTKADENTRQVIIVLFGMLIFGAWFLSRRRELQDLKHTIDGLVSMKDVDSLVFKDDDVQHHDQVMVFEDDNDDEWNYNYSDNFPATKEKHFLHENLAQLQSASKNLKKKSETFRTTLFVTNGNKIENWEGSFTTNAHKRGCDLIFL